jgi:hypothetical protein
LTVPLPDFSDCSFATREPDVDWLAITHEGGPVRGFHRLMPAFGAALSREELQRILNHIRHFCTDDAWPRGELNLPRALVTEKAYPEDEALITAGFAAEGAAESELELIYEKRIGPRSQVELVLPLSYRGGSSSGAGAGIGDVAVALKHALRHDLRNGQILSLGTEVVLPTGDRAEGFGKGSVIFEPFVAFGQILPRDSFVQMQLLAELPAESRIEDEVQLRTAIGRTWTQGEFGRSWTPMLELIGAQALDGSHALWDVVPQCQVTLNTRQHIMASLGVRMPLTDSGERDTQVLLYFLWDWFDGGLLEGW